MLPYGIVPAVAVIYLAVRHVGSEEASVSSRRLVCGLTAASFLILQLGPWVTIPATLLQVGICLYVIFFQAIMGPPSFQNKPDNLSEKTKATDY